MRFKFPYFWLRLPDMYNPYKHYNFFKADLALHRGFDFGTMLPNSLKRIADYQSERCYSISFRLVWSEK